MSGPLVQCKCQIEDIHPDNMTDEEFQHWVGKHHPDEMGFVGREGVDEDEYTE